MGRPWARGQEKQNQKTEGTSEKPKPAGFGTVRQLHLLPWSGRSLTLGTWEEHSHHPHGTMTKLQQHQQAMKANGFSPYCGWIWEGKQVSEQDWLALDAKQAKREGWV